MSTVVVMLGGEGALPQPKQPAFFTETSPLEADSPESKNAAFSGDSRRRKRIRTQLEMDANTFVAFEPEAAAA
ncbi:hypothetical protein C3L33_13126, partial [Rhododendron williamsianum]